MLINKLKEIRIQKGRTQAEVAEYINLSQNTISNYENGHRGMSEEDLEKYARFLGYEVSLTKIDENKLLKGINFNKSHIDWKQKGIDFFNQIWKEEKKFTFPTYLHPNSNDTKDVLINKKLFFSSFLSAATCQDDPYDQNAFSDKMVYVDYSDKTVAHFGQTVAEINCIQFQSRLEYLYHNQLEFKEMFDSAELRVSVKAFDMKRGDITFPVFPSLVDTLAVNKYVSLGFDLFTFKRNLSDV